jgi:hypothetical protein
MSEIPGKPKKETVNCGFRAGVTALETSKIFHLSKLASWKLLETPMTS